MLVLIVIMIVMHVTTILIPIRIQEDDPTITTALWIIVVGRSYLANMLLLLLSFIVY